MAIRRRSAVSDRLELGGEDAFVIGEEALDSSPAHADPGDRADRPVAMPSAEAVEPRQASLRATAGQPRHRLRPPAASVAVAVVGVAVVVASSLLGDGSSAQPSTGGGQLARVKPHERLTPNRLEATHPQDGPSARSVRREGPSHQREPSRPRANEGRAEPPAPARSVPVAVEPPAAKPAPPAPPAPDPVVPVGQPSADPEPMSRQEIIAREFGP